MQKTYRNYEELLEDNEDLAIEILNNKGEGPWGIEDIYWYSDVASFAEYELTNGFYSSLNLERDWNGAPNPMVHIDLTSLGNHLVRTWDDSAHFHSEDGSVLATGYGW